MFPGTRSKLLTIITKMNRYSPNHKRIGFKRGIIACICILSEKKCKKESRARVTS